MKIPEVQSRLQGAVETVFGSTESNRILKPLESLRWVEYGLTYEVPRQGMLDVFTKLRDGSQFLFNMLVELTAVDWMDRREPRFEVVYHLLSITHGHRLTLKVKVDESNPEVDSVRSLWPTANFLEREVWDMFGITFKGHGDLRRILMYDEFVGHPLRKDYPIRGKQPRIPLRLPELRNDSEDMIREELVSLPVPRRRTTNE